MEDKLNGDKDFMLDDGKDISNNTSTDLMVGQRLRDLRTRSGYSLRALAERSALNINTLSLIENGKSSPSVSTLQQLALALDVPITAFLNRSHCKRALSNPSRCSPEQTFGSTRMQNWEKTRRQRHPAFHRHHHRHGQRENRIVHTALNLCIA
jgi:transcriptional regulator with XRE-family HTH domain